MSAIQAFPVRVGPDNVSRSQSLTATHLAMQHNPLTSSAESDRAPVRSVDALVIGSGCSGLVAALAAARAGLSVLVIEKTAKLGGTSAMSGAGTWVPANHHAAAAGLADSPDEALAYIRAIAPPGWHNTEDRLWNVLVTQAPAMLAFVERYTPLRFKLTPESDPYPDAPGAKAKGRMLSPQALSRWRAGRYCFSIRASTLPEIFTYNEGVETDLYHRPVATCVSLAGRLVWRFLTNSAGKGTALVTGLVRGCLDLGVQFQRETRARDLIVEDGRIVGAFVETRATTQIIRAERGVLIASGGFEWDATLRETHFPGARYLGTPASNEGDGLRMARVVGATLDHLEEATITPCMPTRYEGRLAAIPVPYQTEPNSIIVDRTGKRFVNEQYFNLGDILNRRDPQTNLPKHLPAWVISDAHYLRRLPVARWFARFDPSWMVRAETLPALADRLGIPADALSATVARYNGFCRVDKDEDFGRPGQSGTTGIKDMRKKAGMEPIKEPPFVGIRIDPSILSTKGGPRTNENGQVIRTDGSVIQALYCAGAAMANPIGTKAVGAGTTIGPYMTWGYVCGQHMAGLDN